LCEEVPRQNAAKSRKIPESDSVIPKEGVESLLSRLGKPIPTSPVIPKEGVESYTPQVLRFNLE
jgi:hypothetical protein